MSNERAGRLSQLAAYITAPSMFLGVIIGGALSYRWHQTTPLFIIIGFYLAYIVLLIFHVIFLLHEILKDDR